MLQAILSEFNQEGMIAQHMRSHSPSVPCSIPTEGNIFTDEFPTQANFVKLRENPNKLA